MALTFERSEVSKHNTLQSLWIIIDHKVFDLSDFVDAHPGGPHVLSQAAGSDATKLFYSLHRHEVLERFKSLSIGTISGETPEIHAPEPGTLSLVPYGEPLWLTPQFSSPYYNEGHRRLQRAVRIFADKYIASEANQKEKDGTVISQGLIDRMAETNILAMRLGPGSHLHGRRLLEGVIKGEEFEYFHDLIVSQEMTRAGTRGFQDGNMAGMIISLTALRQWMDDSALKERITQECLSGKKKICLAVSEAFAGSDVAGIQTTAEKTLDGKHYIIRGTKKWITNGMFCDYFIVGCKTENGFSVILVERDENVETRKIETAYSTASGVAFVQFNGVRVPVSHLLGKEHQGFEVIMSNFNHERWFMTAAVVRRMRTVVEECFKWAHQRTVSKQALIQQPAIRQKLARMIATTEACQSWLETITFQMNAMSYEQQSKVLAGPIGLLKFYATRCAHDVADDAVNIFGGRALTTTGMGRVVEHFHRTYKFDAILGGTEEVLADLGVRQAMKRMPKAVL